MRDPDGRLEMNSSGVRRVVRPDAPSLPFLHTSAAKEQVNLGRLLPYTFLGDHSIESPRIAFVTHPYEWADSQLNAAANLTLELAAAALQVGYELKDASAWNVIFAGTTPVFCDHLSFVPIKRPQWWAFGQFARHFIYPHALAKFAGLHGYESFSLYRDGPSLEKTRSLLGLRRYFTRYWPLLIRAKSGANQGMVIKNSKEPKEPLHPFLFAICRYTLRSESKLKADSKSNWARYAVCRQHYIASDLAEKKTLVSRWLAHIKPSWVLDLGCNTGEFSLLALDTGANVISVDQDHDSIETLYSARRPCVSLYPVISSLSDLSGGRGFSGEEFPSLMARLQGMCDCVLMLALIHHLAISEALPFDCIASLAHRLTRRYVIVEYIPENDPMVIAMAASRDRLASEFAIEAQTKAFRRFFSPVAEYALPGNGRILELLERLN